VAMASGGLDPKGMGPLPAVEVSDPTLTWAWP
jgi:hypothetical protein